MTSQQPPYRYFVVFKTSGTTNNAEVPLGLPIRSHKDIQFIEDELSTRIGRPVVVTNYKLFED